MELFGVRLPFGGGNDDYDLDGDEEFDDYYEEGPSGTALQPRKRREQSDGSSLIKKFAPVPKKNNNNSRSELMDICLIHPESMDDAKDLTDILLNGQPVLLNLEGIDRDIAQRIIDFACGSTYAVRGNLSNISNYIYVITPQNVGLTGDFPKAATGSLDVKSLRG